MTIYGIDYLAGARFQQAILQSHPNGFAAGFFAETFGDAFPTIDKLLATGKCPLVRIQLLWSDGHTFGDANLSRAKTLARKCQALANKYPRVDVRVSPFCEYGKLAKGFDHYGDIIQLEAPNCTIVASPSHPFRGAPSKKYINESHGADALFSGRSMYSVDGGFPRRQAKPEDAAYDDVTDVDVTALKAKNARAEVFFFWHSRCNLRWNSKDRANRALRIKQSNVRGPTADFLRGLSALAGEKGRTSIPQRTTAKSHADNHGPNPQTGALDSKGDKFLIIYPKKVNEIVLKAEGTNRVVAKLRYYGTFSDGRFRYYATTLGWKIGRVDIYVNGKRVGTANCAFRDGDFRQKVTANKFYIQTEVI